MTYSVEKVDSSSFKAMINFLKKQENYTLFLLGNFESYGFSLSDEPYSGNFKLIRQSSGQVVGVFCLTQIGNLLIESSVQEPIFDLVLSACQKENIEIKGVVGNWEICKPFWEFLKKEKWIQKETLVSKEILFSVDLESISSFSISDKVRFLIEDDFLQWKQMHIDYCLEKGLPDDFRLDQLFEEFLDKVKKKISWGLFIDHQLVSIADLNAKALDLGQVGGVYTIPGFRRKGFSRMLLQKLFMDVKHVHKIRKLIIFTGEDNFPALKLYRSLGALEVGHFALLFGSKEASL